MHTKQFFRILGHLWALPNTLIGLAFGIGGTFRRDRANRVWVVEGGWMAAIFGRRGYAGMCVGDVVLSPAGSDLPTLYPRVYRHELVHATQARLLGPLYLPLTLLGYALGVVLCPGNAHDGSPLEIWADAASGNAAGNEFVKRRQTRHRADSSGK